MPAPAPQADAEVLLDAEAEDGSLPDAALPDMDGDSPAASDEAGPDDEAGRDAEADALAMEADAQPDAGADAEADGSAPVCSPEDLTAWSNGHTQEGLVALIAGCFATCKQDATCADKCVHDEQGLQDCATCTSAQSVCTTSLCGAACTVSKSDGMCLACLCEADCVGVFERCASAKIAVCSPGLFGRDASPEEHMLDAPILLRQKTQTGGLRAVRLEVSGAQTWPTSSSFQFSTGFDKLVSFPLAGREYVLHAKSTCAADPCIARVSPILNDGSFGRPVYDQSWTRGFDEAEMFTLGTTPYLLRSKSGRLATDADPAGTVWVDRMDLDVDHTTLQLTAAARTLWLTSAQQPFTLIEPFQLAGETFLLLGGGTDGELHLLRVQQSADTLSFPPAAAPTSWPGVDVVETLKVGATWFVFTYDNAEGDAQRGTARLFGFVAQPEGGVALTAPLYEASWDERVTHAIGYVTEGASFLLTHDAATGRANQRALAQDTDEWSTSFATVLGTQAVGFNPPWNVVEVAGQGKW